MLDETKAQESQNVLEATMTVTTSFDPFTGRLTYHYAGCGLTEAIGLMEMAKLHAFNDMLAQEQENEEAI